MTLQIARIRVDNQQLVAWRNLESLLGSKSQSVVKVDAVGAALAPKQILGDLLPRLNNRITASASILGPPASVS